MGTNVGGVCGDRSLGYICGSSSSIHHNGNCENSGGGGGGANVL